MLLGNQMNSLQSLQLYGLLNAVKTGDARMDAVLALVLPMMMTSVLGSLLSSKNKGLSLLDETFLVRWLRGNAYTRSITYRCYQHANAATTNLDNDSRNEYLVRAIKLFLHQKCNLDLQDADVDLTDIGKRKRDGVVASSTKSLLSSCELVKKPVQMVWHNVGVFEHAQVRLWMSDQIGSDSALLGSDTNQKIRTVVLKLVSSKKSSVDNFINAALELYESQLAKLETHHRYFFDVASFMDLKSVLKSVRCPVYQSYRLCGEKTFDTIFSQPSKQLIKLVDDFTYKRGKYGVEGFPYKLGILLHGEPGTGKTSLIKALAHHTKRHIVNVPLARIEKNQDLRDIFFNRSFAGASGDAGAPSRLNFQDIVFVLEDVDAASKIVSRRQDSKSLSGTAENGKDQERKSANDDLSLAGILNVFDGIVATPGRIIVMTTNHPELLDPALVRPGRIDKTIELTYMTAVDAIDMLEHYFAVTLDQKERALVAQLIENGTKITPATMERYILEMDTVEEVIRAVGSKKMRTF